MVNLSAVTVPCEKQVVDYCVLVLRKYFLETQQRRVLL